MPIDLSRGHTPPGRKPLAQRLGRALLLASLLLASSLTLAGQGKQDNGNGNNAEHGKNGQGHRSNIKSKVSDPSEVFDNAGASGATVDADGALQLSSDSKTLALKSTAAEGVGIKLSKNKQVTFGNEHAALKVTDLGAGSVLVTRKVQGKTLIALDSGTARIEAVDDSVPIPVAIRQNQAVGVLTAKNPGFPPVVVLRRSAEESSAYVESGDSLYQEASGSTAGAAGTGAIYHGETAHFAPDGSIAYLQLGSLDGDRNLPGDPLAHVPGAEPGLLIPQLQGSVARLGGVSLLDAIHGQIDAALGLGSGSQVGFDPATGIVGYAYRGAVAYFVPLGKPTISLAGFAASSAAAVAAGTFTLVDRGVQLTLSSTLGYFQEFDAAVKQLDPAGKVVLKSSGALQLDLGGNQYFTQPGYLALGGGIAGQPAILQAADGQLNFRDSKGGTQVLYPTLADAGTLQAALQKLDPAASLQLHGDGTAAMAIARGSFTLLPSYAVIALPAAHASDDYWLDQGNFYYRTASGRAQGVRVK